MTYRKWLGQFFNWQSPYISLVLYCCAACAWVIYSNYESNLQNPADLIAGIAAIEDVDIGARVNLYYKVLGSFSLVFIVSSYLFYRLELRYPRFQSLLIPWSWMALGGLILLYLNVVDSPQVITQKLWVALMICLLVFQIIRYRLQSRLLQNSNHAFWWLALLSGVLSIGWRTISFAIWGEQAFDFQVPFTVCFLLLIVCLQLLQRYSSIHFTTLVNASIPLFFIPLLTTIGDEVYMILNQREVHSVAPMFIHSLIILAIVGAVIYRVSRNKRIGVQRAFHRYIYPAVLCGIAAVAWYDPILKTTRDFFELANPANAIMRIFEFQEFPIVQALSSHLLSEVASPLLYCLLNGYDGSINFRVYNFIPVLVFLYLTYRFLAKAFDNSVFTFGVLCLLPFNQAFYFLADIGNHVLFFVNLFLIYRLCENYSRKKLWQLGLWSAFLIVWKVDVAIPALAATVFLLLLCFWRPLRKKLAIDFAYISLLLGGAAILFAAILTYAFNIDIPGNFMQAKDYFGAQQAHGLPTLTSYVGRVFYFHYVLFPVASFVMLVYLLTQFGKSYFGSKRFLYISLIGLIVYYFINAQRGLVRHSMLEGTDIFISSFFYMTAALFAYYLFYKKRPARVLFLFTLIFLIGIVKYKIPRGYLNLVEELHLNYRTNNPIPYKKKKIERCTDFEAFANYRFRDIEQLMTDHYKKEATFIDFTHAPMLYYYLQRPVPSYFNQYLQNTVTEYLQEKNIEHLQNYDVPITLFSHHPEKSWDRLDKIPNTVRYHLLANYIYEHYEPLGIFNQHYLWIQKGDSIPNFESNIDSSYIHEAKTYDLKHYPRLLANKMKTNKSLSGAIEINTSKLNTTADYLLIELELSKKDTKTTLRYFHNNSEAGSFTFTAIKSNQGEAYVIPAGSQYNWYLNRADYITLEFEGDQPPAIKAIKMFDIPNQD